MKKLLSLIILIVVFVAFSACGNQEADDLTSESDNGKVKVLVSFDAMKEFTQAVGKDKVEISTIIPIGAESHDFEPKAQDMVKINEADIFVYNGLGMEAWVEEALASIDNSNLIVVEASKGSSLIRIDQDDDHEGEDKQSKYDPHIWLSLKGAQVETLNIKKALIQVDPDNKSFYEQNCDEFMFELEALHKEYKKKFKSLENKDFVTGHAAFAYLCRDFGLDQKSISGIFAEGEPSANNLTELVDYCKKNEVTTIFAEEMVNSEISQTLAKEVGAKVETIYTMENAQDNLTYLERMESNLSKIYRSLSK